MADDNNQLPSIDADMLAAVTGGASSSDETVAAALQSLMSSIKDIASARQNTNPFGDMMPMMMMMMMMNRPSPAPVVAAPSVGPDGMPIGPGGWERIA